MKYEKLENVDSDLHYIQHSHGYDVEVEGYATINTCNVEHGQLNNVTLYRSNLVRCSAMDVNLNRCRLVDCDVAGVNIYNLKAVNGIIRWNTILPLPMFDWRGYIPRLYWHKSGEWWINSGCRVYSLSAAEEHWKSFPWVNAYIAGEYQRMITLYRDYPAPDLSAPRPKKASWQGEQS